MDILEKRILQIVPLFAFLMILFFPLDLAMKIFLISALFFFFILFFLCTYWAAEWHPERKFKIGFLVSFLHTFIFFLGGFLGFAFAFFALKIFPFLIDYLRGTFPF